MKSNPASLAISLASQPSHNRKAVPLVAPTGSLARYRREWTPWTGGDAVLVKWFETHRQHLPSESFTLKPGVQVCDPSKFYRALEADIRNGKNGVRAAGLNDDLKWLARRMAEGTEAGN